MLSKNKCLGVTVRDEVTDDKISRKLADNLDSYNLIIIVEVE